MTIFDLAATQAAARLADLRVIDVREADEFRGPLGHIPGAELVPLGGIERAAAEWDRDRPLLLVCRGGRRSRTAAERLARRGFTHLYNLDQGMNGWHEAALPVCDEHHGSGIVISPACAAEVG